MLLSQEIEGEDHSLSSALIRLHLDVWFWAPQDKKGIDYTGASSSEATQTAGAGVQVLWGEAEELGLVQLGEEMALAGPNGSPLKPRGKLLRRDGVRLFAWGAWHKNRTQQSKMETLEISCVFHSGDD